MGSGIAIVESAGPQPGSTIQSLVMDYTVPLLEKDSLRFIGTVTFSLLTVIPYKPPEAMRDPVDLSRLWTAGRTKVVGHRGKRYCEVPLPHRLTE